MGLVYKHYFLAENMLHFSLLRHCFIALCRHRAGVSAREVAFLSSYEAFIASAQRGDRRKWRHFHGYFFSLKDGEVKLWKACNSPTCSGAPVDEFTPASSQLLGHTSLYPKCNACRGDLLRSRRALRASAKRSLEPTTPPARMVS